ncbi:MAG: flippase-like domain-containing protein [Gemmatimonadetes bacterium]|nr:flippase-like domain-containing protein [Gemmatimonadota bacterium]
MPLALTPRLLRRGLELFALISVTGVAGLLFYGNNFGAFVHALLHIHWGWLAIGLALASMDWVGGGFRLWVVTRHVHPGVRLRHMILAGGMGAWAAYLTPFQSGSSPISIWRMTKGGVRIPEAMTSVFITFVATVAFFAIAGPLAIVFGAGRSLERHGVVLGITLYDLFKTSLGVFVLIGIAMFAAIIFPRAVRNLVHWAAVHIGRRSASVGARMELLTAGIDRAHDCMVAFGSSKGLLTLLLATIISGPSHANKLLAGFVTLKALGIEANFYDILLLQTFISFLLYFAPTPGASGLAELISAAVMSIYVPRVLTPSYILIWRFINSYATVITGSALFWYWMRRGLIGKEAAVAV